MGMIIIGKKIITFVNEIIIMMMMMMMMVKMMILVAHPLEEKFSLYPASHPI